MKRRKMVNVALAGALALAPLGLGACDNEDQKDVEEVGNEIEKGAEDAANEAEKEVDKLDDDGKDDSNK